MRRRDRDAFRIVLRTLVGPDQSFARALIRFVRDAAGFHADCGDRTCVYRAPDARALGGGEQRPGPFDVCRDDGMAVRPKETVGGRNVKECIATL